MKLKIYTDNTLSEVKEVRDVPRIKVPYRTAEAVMDMLDELGDLKNINGFNALTVALKNRRHLTVVVRATFGLTDEELECVDMMELGDVANEITGYVMSKIESLNTGESNPNAQEPMTETT